MHNDINNISVSFFRVGIIFFSSTLPVDNSPFQDEIKSGGFAWCWTLLGALDEAYNRQNEDTLR